MEKIGGDWSEAMPICNYFLDCLGQFTRGKMRAINYWKPIIISTVDGSKRYFIGKLAMVEPFLQPRLTTRSSLNPSINPFQRNFGDLK